MSELFRFPHTPHLAWLAPQRLRGDKLLSKADVQELLRAEILVEEKVDGANLGFSVDEQGILRAQNRGSYVSLDEPRGQWRPLRRWVEPRTHVLAEALYPHLILFGEWCYAVHSIRYSRLPDWFLAFDVYDRESGVFWCADRRDALVSRLGLASVPRLGTGRFDLPGLESLLAASRLTDGPAEGLYIRRDVGDRLVARAKLVRPEFVQAIDEHWSKRALEPNSLAAGKGESRAWH